MEARNEKRETGRGERADAGSETRHTRSSAIRRAIRSDEDIEAYQGAMELLAPLDALILRFPDYERFELASQLRRASKSIPANVAEGLGKKRSVREFNNALGSAEEVFVHLKIAGALGCADRAALHELVEGYTIIAKQLCRLIENWQTFGTRQPVPHPASRVQIASRIQMEGHRYE